FQLHDFDSGAGLPVLASGPGTSRLVVGGHRGGGAGGEASAQSSESDSGRVPALLMTIRSGSTRRRRWPVDLHNGQTEARSAAADSCGGSSTMRTPPRLTRNFVGYGGGGGVSEHLLNAGPYPTQQQQQQQQQHPLYQQRLCSESRLV
uniref:Pumilio n=1 Tax=Macrostomum lignano TaxID=282301 RepID=A0A1I8H2A0_9PLAT